MLRKLWNADFSKVKLPNLTLLWLVFGAFIAVQQMDSPIVISFKDLFDRYFLGGNSADSSSGFSAYLFIGITAFFVFYTMAFVVLNERASIKKIGKEKLYAIIVPHFLASLIDIVLAVIIILGLGQLAEQLLGREVNIFGLLDLSDPLHPFKALIDFYNEQIPTYIELPYLLAILVILLLGDLPVYAIHLWTHKSRFLWLVVHRSHQTPEFLHPYGSGPVFGFPFLVAVPGFLIVLACSKLVYPEPMLVELMIIQMLNMMTERFNHATPFYHVAFKNKFLFYLFRFFGNGPYHYTHHSAKPGEGIVNIANVCFNFWDRVFGTYLEPSREKPPVGLTRSPKIKLNPLRLYFGGIATLLYELKHNEAKHWFKIICGSVYYTPPITKDYLIVKYSDDVVVRSTAESEQV